MMRDTTDDRSSELGSDGIFTGRRSFDRQLEMLTIAVHTLQSGFGIAQDRLKVVQDQMKDLNAALQSLEQQTHSLDKALVARIATITVAERVLWIVITVLIGLAAKVFG